MATKKLKSKIVVSKNYLEKCRVRRAFVNLSYTRGASTKIQSGILVNGRLQSDDQKKKTAKTMRQFLRSFTFTGAASGEADRIEVTFANNDWRWMRQWMPRKKDKISASIVTKVWKKGLTRKRFSCGTFLIDNMRFSGPELTCTVSATSIPETASFRTTERTKSWKKITILEIAKKISKRYHMALVFDAENFSVGTVEQNSETDCAFLTNLCDEYAYGIKIFKGKIIIYSKEKYEKKKVVGTIDRSMMIDFDWETNIAGTYTGARMAYCKNDDDKELVVKVGKGNRWLTVSGDADSVSQARRKALAALNTANEKTTTLNISIPGSTKYSETDTVQIKDLYRLNGKYFIDQITHTIDATSGFVTQLSMHKVMKRASGSVVVEKLKSTIGVMSR